MGELEEKETGPSETSPQQEVVDEPKETDKMLEKKDDTANPAEQQTENTGAKDKNPSPSGEKKKAASSKPTTPTSLGKKSPTQSIDKLNTGSSGGGGDVEAQPAKVNGGNGEEIINELYAGIDKCSE